MAHDPAPAESTKRPPRRSIARRFNLVLLGLYLVSVAVAAPAVYYITQKQVQEQADRELGMLVDMVRSIQGYVARHLRPFLIEKDLFHSPGFSGIVATALIAENFKQRQPNYYIKTVSDNPLNRNNMTQPFESELLERFRSTPTSKKIKEVGTLDGQLMLVSAAPKVSKVGCLMCHGDVERAPKQITEQFGTSTGYNYKVGDIVGVSVVGVPLGDVKILALTRSLYMIGLLTVLFALVFFSVNLMVRRLLLQPILGIASTAHGISKGRVDQPVEVKRNDEIGDLAKSIELLRRSFVHALSRLQKG